MRWTLLFGVFLCALSARAQSLGVGVLAGGQVSTSRLGASFDGTFKLQHPMSEWFEVFAELGYSQPSTTRTGTSDALGPSGSTQYTTSLMVQELMLTAGAAYVFRTPLEGLRPYAGVAARVYFLRTTASGSDPNPFGQNVEGGSAVGALAMAGVGYSLGPGRLLGELQLGWAPVSQQLTGGSNLGAISLLLGYGFLL